MDSVVRVDFILLAEAACSLILIKYGVTRGKRVTMSFRTKLLRSRLVFALFILSSGICTAQTAASQLRVSLIPSTKIYSTARTVMFAGKIKNKLDTDATLDSSRLIVKRHNGEVVFSQDRAFHIPENHHSLKGSIGALSIGFGRCLPDSLKEGDYDAVWVVNGINSNVVSFQIQSSMENRLPTLYIEKAVRNMGTPDDEGILGFIRNDQTTGMDLFDLWQGHALYVDGKAYQPKIIKWAGISSLAPGESWGFMVFLLDYIDKIEPGIHSIQFEMGGLRSNLLKIEWPAR